MTIRINHRGVFNAFLSRLDLSGKSEDILRIIDKLAKIGRAETAALLTEVTGSSAISDKILDYSSGSTSFDATLSLMA